MWWVFFPTRLYRRYHKNSIPLAIPCVKKIPVQSYTYRNFDFIPSIKALIWAIKNMTNQPVLPVSEDDSASLTVQPQMACWWTIPIPNQYFLISTTRHKYRDRQTGTQVPIITHHHNDVTCTSIRSVPPSRLVVYCSRWSVKILKMGSKWYFQFLFGIREVNCLA